MRSRKGITGVHADLPELRLQIMEQGTTFRECNYSLYPSRLAYPWPHSYFMVLFCGPYSIERCDRSPARSEAEADGAMPGAATHFSEGLNAAGVAAALLEFAASTPRPARALLNLNTGMESRSVNGLLLVQGCRIATVGKSSTLATLGGINFVPPLCTAPADEPGARRHIVIRPGTRVELALPLALAEAARRRPRPGQRIEAVEILPSVFADAASFRSLWPDGPPPVPGARYRLAFGVAGGSPTVAPQVLTATPPEELLPAEQEA
jgi:hypothetical protein